MSASQTHAAMEVHVLMGWPALLVSAYQATLGCIARRVSLWVVGMILFSSYFISDKPTHVIIVLLLVQLFS